VNLILVKKKKLFKMPMWFQTEIYKIKFVQRRLTFLPVLFTLLILSPIGKILFCFVFLLCHLIIFQYLYVCICMCVCVCPFLKINSSIQSLPYFPLFFIWQYILEITPQRYVEVVLSLFCAAENANFHLGCF
jgi:hypothetical protein